MRHEFMEALAKAREAHSLEHREILILLQARGEEVDALGRAADGVRAASLGDEVHYGASLSFPTTAAGTAFTAACAGTTGICGVTA